MYTIFMNSENSKTSDHHRLLINLRSDKYVALSNLSTFYTCKNIKTSYKKHKFKTSALKWNEEFELPDGSFFCIRFSRWISVYLQKNMRQLLIILQ